jgi:redox-sensitive bicupin YhaK (pirin superfamily)
MVHATLAPGAQLRLPWRTDFNALVYALTGRGAVGLEGTAIHDGQLAVLGSGDAVTVAAAPDSTLDVIVLGGAPIREPLAWAGPFVMNTEAEVRQAFDDFQRGRLGTVPPDDRDA